MGLGSLNVTQQYNKKGDGKYSACTHFRRAASRSLLRRASLTSRSFSTSTRRFSLARNAAGFLSNSYTHACSGGGVLNFCPPYSSSHYLSIEYAYSTLFQTEHYCAPTRDAESPPTHLTPPRTVQPRDPPQPTSDYLSCLRWTNRALVAADVYSGVPYLVYTSSVS